MVYKVEEILNMKKTSLSSPASSANSVVRRVKSAKVRQVNGVTNKTGVVKKQETATTKLPDKQKNGETLTAPSKPSEPKSPTTNGNLFPTETLQNTETPDTVIDPKLMLFFEALREGSVMKVKTLLRNKNINMNTKNCNDPNAPTALIVACETNNAEIVRLLLSSKKARSLDVNQEDNAGRKPIWIAAWKGNAEIADLLLNSKGTECDVNFTDKETGTTPLFRAILSNSGDVVQLLIHAKADVNMRVLGRKSSHGETPLIKAVQMDNMKIVEHLVNALCKIQHRTEDGFTALHFAVAYKRYEIAKFLLKNEIKIHAKSNFGITPMTVAIEHRNAAMVKLLVEYGYKMDKRYKWKETPLNQAINLHSEECAITLIHQGCDLTRKRGHSYFYMAVDEKLIRLVKFMAAVQPQFLQEDWIKTKTWPVSIYHQPELMRWLEEKSLNVSSLRQLCRGRIFRLLGKYPSHKIKSLNLDEDMNKYLSYTTHVKEDFYTQQPLNVKANCPIDCPAICSFSYCPPIEFSSSSESEESINDDEVSANKNSQHKCKNGHSQDNEEEAEKCCNYCS